LFAELIIIVALFFSLIVASSSFFLSELCFANHQLIMLISAGTYLTDLLAGSLDVHTSSEMLCFD
jgi:hypothetical protein